MVWSTPVNLYTCAVRGVTFPHQTPPTLCALLPPLPDHQCCGRYYIPVATGEVCCLDPGQGRVSVGVGDACCGRVPYSPSGGQLCCGGLLHDGYRSQCCGSIVIEDSLVCCGDAERGMPYTPLTGDRFTQATSYTPLTGDRFTQATSYTPLTGDRFTQATPYTPLTGDRFTQATSYT
ncbi:unnamed protein product, partial [Oncorhynchus mykiss]